MPKLPKDILDTTYSPLHSLQDPIKTSYESNLVQAVNPNAPLATDVDVIGVVPQNKIRQIDGQPYILYNNVKTPYAEVMGPVEAERPNIYSPIPENNTSLTANLISVGKITTESAPPQIIDTQPQKIDRPESVSTKGAVSEMEKTWLDAANPSDENGIITKTLESAPLEIIQTLPPINVDGFPIQDSAIHAENVNPATNASSRIAQRVGRFFGGNQAIDEIVSPLEIAPSETGEQAPSETRLSPRYSEELKVDNGKFPEQQAPIIYTTALPASKNETEKKLETTPLPSAQSDPIMPAPPEQMNEKRFETIPLPSAQSDPIMSAPPEQMNEKRFETIPLPSEQTATYSTSYTTTIEDNIVVPATNNSSPITNAFRRFFGGNNQIPVATSVTDDIKPRETISPSAPSAPTGTSLYSSQIKRDSGVNSLQSPAQHSPARSPSTRTTLSDITGRMADILQVSRGSNNRRNTESTAPESSLIGEINVPLTISPLKSSSNAVNAVTKPDKNKERSNSIVPQNSMSLAQPPDNSPVSGNGAVSGRGTVPGQGLTRVKSARNMI